MPPNLNKAYLSFLVALVIGSEPVIASLSEVLKLWSHGLGGSLPVYRQQIHRLAMIRIEDALIILILIYKTKGSGGTIIILLPH